MRLHITGGGLTTEAVTSTELRCSAWGALALCFLTEWVQVVVSE